jgi:putative DNA primase/helicase
MTPDEIASHARARGSRVLSAGRGTYKASCPVPTHGRGAGDRNPSMSISPGSKGRQSILCCHAGCEEEDIIVALGLAKADMFPPKQEPGPGVPRKVADYRYEDEDGRLLYSKERWEPGRNGGSKSCSYYRLLPGGKKQYKDVFRGPDAARKVVFRLRRVLDTALAGGEITWVEGEKSVLALERLGVVATTAGACKDWRPEMAASFKGASLVRVIADNDAPGIAHARQVAAALSPVVDRVIILRGLVDTLGADVVDHLDAGYALAEMRPLADAEPPQPDPAPTPERTEVAEGGGSAVSQLGQRGQLRMAERFAVEHGQQLRHVHGLGWHCWDGQRWLANEDRAELRAAVATVKAALTEVSRLEGNEREALYKDVRRCESSSALEGLLKIASALDPLSTASKALDADPFLFNTAAGTLDLHTGAVRPHSRADLVTKVAGGVNGPSNGDSEWETFIQRILPDEEVRAFVQRLFGYAMSGKVTEHVMPIFTGSGANGKGTLRDALMAAFGDYAIEVDPAILMESKHERHGAFKMRLRGARLVFCSETEKGRRFAEATMKRLVGGDPIEANLMHKNPITFDPSHTLIMLTNHLPMVSGDDPAVWRRILVVPFDVVIPENERDGELPSRLRLAASEIVSWAHQGWLAYQEQGLNPPEAVQVRTKAYQAASDVLARFLDERVIPSPNATEKAREMFSAWTKWCHENGEQAGAEADFSASMAARGFEKKRANSGMLYCGLMLASEDEEPED